jgi:signal transduction histidine kinase/CheY-like chemotaxis protein
MGDTHIECFAQLVHRLYEPLLIASVDGRIVAANATAAEALGTSVVALDGDLLANYTSDPGGLGQRLRALAGERPFPLRGRDGRRLSCKTRPLNSELVLLRLSGPLEGGPRTRVFFEELSSLHGITAAASDNSRVERIARALLEQGMSSVGAHAAGIHLVDENGNNLELACSVGYRDESVERFRLVSLAAPLPLVDAVREGGPILLGTPEDYASRYPDFARAHPQIAHVAMACMPLEVEGRTIGVLGLGFPMPQTFSDEDRSRLYTFALQCATAFDQAPRVELDSPSSRPLTEATWRLERLQAFTGALARAITPADVVEAVVDVGMAATSARAGELWLLSQDGSTACLARGIGPIRSRPEDSTGIPLDQPVQMPSLDAIRGGTPVWIESRSQLEERYPTNSHTFDEGGETSLACVPLFAQGRCIGAVAYYYEGAHHFREDERAFLQVISRHAAQAIDRARLYAAEKRAKEEAEANQRRSQLLAQAGTLLAAPLDYASTLTLVAQAAVPSFADWCIVELEEERLRGAPPIAAHVDPAKIPFVLELSRRYREKGNQRGIRGVMRSGKSQFHPSIAMDQLREALKNTPELGELFASTGLTSSMVVPIPSRGRTLGAIVLNSARPERHYDEHDLEAAEELGRRVGLAVDNARLFRDVREADRAKDEFLAVLSHELRNPLAPILSALDLMKLRGGDAFLRERAIISRHVRHLVRLVDDLLDVSRVTRGSIQLKKAPWEVSEVIAEAVEMASPLLEERAHDLKVSAPRRGLWVMADQVRLAQAIANLLINAAKYTEPGGTIAIVASGEGSEVIIRVRDSGHGIASETIPKIFDLFVQGESSLGRAKGGLGIGLTVVKRVVDLHGGSVSALSEGLGHGSEFVIRLPLASKESPPPSPVPSRHSLESEGVRLRALVVDDNEDAAYLVGEALELLGCSVQIAHDGAAGLAAFAASTPDLVLLDIGLPDIDGYTLARKLRALPASASTRIIAVTGYGQESDRVRTREAGFSEHFVKPVNIDALGGILARCRRGRDA